MIEKKVIWSERAKQSLRDHYDYIKADSVSAAQKVKSEIIEATKGLSAYPEKYQLDEFYPNNPGNIRRFFCWSYRIIYQINDSTLAILNVIHVSQEPNRE